MAQVNLPVVAGGGGWTPVGAYPANQNDGDAGTYQGWPGDTAGTNANFYDYTQIPDGAIISSVSVSGLWGAGSAPATASFRFVIGVSSDTLGTINDVTSYSFNRTTKPGGGAWTKADVQSLHMNTVSLQTGNANLMKLRSSVLSVFYVLSGEIFIPIYRG